MLLQSEADELAGVSKRRASDDSYDFPLPGESLHLDIVSVDGREEFDIDVDRGNLNPLKCKYQERCRGNIVLVRLDSAGAAHRNPLVDEPPSGIHASLVGKSIPCPHLHIYVEGFDAKWAIPLPPELNINTDLHELLYDFFNYCNVIDAPTVIKRLL